jgi:hypothetical protein
LSCVVSAPDAGLITNFDALKGPRFDPACVRPEIWHFYEHTASYRLGTWTEAALPTRFFLWFLIRFVSRRMGQLNFPISSLETSRGMTLHTGERGWQRLLGLGAIHWDDSGVFVSVR